MIKIGDKYKNAIIHYKYDKHDRVIERIYYNENNKLIEGEAKIVYDYTKKPDAKDSPYSPWNLLNDPDPKWISRFILIRKEIKYEETFNIYQKRNKNACTTLCLKA